MISTEQSRLVAFPRWPQGSEQGPDLRANANRIIEGERIASKDLLTHCTGAGKMKGQQHGS